MLVLGSDDGVYCLSEPDATTAPAAEQVLETGRVRRVDQFDGQPGVFAATQTGLYHTPDGESWTDLSVPQEQVYTVGARGNRLYAGTKPAHVYTCPSLEAARTDGEDAWEELDGFQDLPSREEWRLPRHENLAQVRDVHAVGEERLVAGVEVGGVHVSDDGGETWRERREGCDDDVHELALIDRETYVSGTGFGLYRTEDAGRTWIRLDEGVPQRYFRAVLPVAGTVYASGAMANSSTWEDDDADNELFVVEGDGLTSVELPVTNEMVAGMTAADDAVFAGTHRGSVLARDSEGTVLDESTDDWTVVGSVPIPGELTGRYTPLTWVDS